VGTKKRMSFIAVLLLAFAFLVVGCSSQNESGGDAKPPSTGEAKQPAAEKKAPEKSPMELAEEFYKDKTINFIISFPTGGGYDSQSRLMAPYLEKYLPGTKVAVENIDGGSGLTGTNRIWEAKPDGLTFGVTGGGGIATWPLVDDPAVKFDTRKLTYFGSLFGEERILSVRNGVGINNVEDFLNYDKELKQAFKAKGGANYITSVLMWSMLPTKKPIKGIFGYRKSSEQMLALERGEVDLYLGSGPNTIPMVKDGKVTPVVAIAEHPGELPDDVTNLWNKEERSVVPEEGIPYMKAVIGIVGAGRPYVGPPGIPEERVKFIEEALQKVAKDPDFREKAAKMGSVVSGMKGAATKQSVMDVLDSPENVKKLIKESN